MVIVLNSFHYPLFEIFHVKYWEERALIGNKQKKSTWFPGSPVVRTWHFTAMAWVQSLVGELRSRKPHGVAKKKKKKKVNEIKLLLIHGP